MNNNNNLPNFWPSHQIDFKLEENDETETSSTEWEHLPEEREIYTSGSVNSIQWADDAIEDKTTEKLQEQLNKINEAFTTGKRSDLSKEVWNELVNWRRAFPDKVEWGIRKEEKATEDIFLERKENFYKVQRPISSIQKNHGPRMTFHYSSHYYFK